MCPQKQQTMTQVPGLLPPMREIQLKLWAPGLSLAPDKAVVGIWWENLDGKSFSFSVFLSKWKQIHNLKISYWYVDYHLQKTR